MFVLGEKVVYAGHGVAKINRIIEKQIGGIITHFFELRFINKDMTILIPTNNLIAVGVRRLSSPENVDAIFKLLSEPAQPLHHELTTSNWNKRNKEYQCRLRTGKLTEIGKIYRDLKHVAAQKELSFGEKSLLNQTELLLAEEIALVGNVGTEKAIELLRTQVGMCMPLKAQYTMTSL